MHGKVTRCIRNDCTTQMVHTYLEAGAVSMHGIPICRQVYP
jgi:hypothetical protein